MYLDPRMTGFYDELTKISGAVGNFGHGLRQAVTGPFLWPALLAGDGEKAMAAGHALGTASLLGGAYAVGNHRGKKAGHEEKDAGMGKQAGLKNIMMGLGAAGTIAGGGAAIAHKAHHLAQPAAQVAKAAPRLIGSHSSQMADLAKEGIKFG